MDLAGGAVGGSIAMARLRRALSRIFPHLHECTQRAAAKTATSGARPRTTAGPTAAGPTAAATAVGGARSAIVHQLG